MQVIIERFSYFSKNSFFFLIIPFKMDIKMPGKKNRNTLILIIVTIALFVF